MVQTLYRTDIPPTQPQPTDLETAEKKVVSLEAELQPLESQMAWQQRVLASRQVGFKPQTMEEALAAGRLLAQAQKGQVPREVLRTQQAYQAKYATYQQVYTGEYLPAYRLAQYRAEQEFIGARQAYYRQQVGFEPTVTQKREPWYSLEPARERQKQLTAEQLARFAGLPPEAIEGWYTVTAMEYYPTAHGVGVRKTQQVFLTEQEAKAFRPAAVAKPSAPAPAAPTWKAATVGGQIYGFGQEMRKMGPFFEAIAWGPEWLGGFVGKFEDVARGAYAWATGTYQPPVPTAGGALVTSIQASFPTTPVRPAYAVMPEWMKTELGKAIPEYETRVFQPTKSPMMEEFETLTPGAQMGAVMGEVAFMWASGKVISKAAGWVARTETGAKITKELSEFFRVPQAVKRVFAGQPVIEAVEKTEDVTAAGAELTVKRLVLGPESAKAAAKATGKTLTPEKATEILAGMKEPVTLQLAVQKGIVAQGFPTKATFAYMGKTVMAEGISAEALKQATYKYLFPGTGAEQTFYTLIKGAGWTGPSLSGLVQQTVQQAATVTLKTVPSATVEYASLATGVAASVAAQALPKPEVKVKPAYKPTYSVDLSSFLRGMPASQVTKSMMQAWTGTPYPGAARRVREELEFTYYTMPGQVQRLENQMLREYAAWQSRPAQIPQVKPLAVPIVTPVQHPTVAPITVPVPIVTPIQIPRVTPILVPAIRPIQVPSITQFQVPKLTPIQIPSVAPIQVPRVTPVPVPPSVPPWLRTGTPERVGWPGYRRRLRGGWFVREWSMPSPEELRKIMGLKVQKAGKAKGRKRKR